MRANSEFTIQLANGRERTFESAAQMVEWMERQLGPQVPRRGWQSTPERKTRGKSKPRGTGKSPGDNPRRTVPRGGQVEAGMAPLARYTKRRRFEV